MSTPQKDLSTDFTEVKAFHPCNLRNLWMLYQIPTQVTHKL
jgi:hypothetical protein